MSNLGNLNTNTSAAETREDIRAVFRKWGQASGSRFVWGESRAVAERRSIYGAASVTYSRDDVMMPPARCGKFATYAANLRAVYGFLDMLRLADARGILGDLVEAGAALLALPAPAPLDAQTEVYPWVELGLLAGATVEQVEAAWRLRVKGAAHDGEALTRLNVARDVARRLLQAAAVGRV